MLKLNKEKFLKTEFGGSLEECVIAWGRYLDERNLQNIDKGLEKSISWCQAQWEVYQLAMKQFYGVECHFSRSEECFGVVMGDEAEWLIKVEREVQ